MIHEKYELSLSLYRQEKEWQMHGLELSRRTTDDGELDDNGGEGLVTSTLRLFRRTPGERRRSSYRRDLLLSVKSDGWA